MGEKSERKIFHNESSGSYRVTRNPKNHKPDWKSSFVASRLMTMNIAPLIPGWVVQSDKSSWNPIGIKTREKAKKERSNNAFTRSKSRFFFCEYTNFEMKKADTKKKKSEWRRSNSKSLWRYWFNTRLQFNTFVSMGLLKTGSKLLLINRKMGKNELHNLFWIWCLINFYMVWIWISSFFIWLWVKYKFNQKCINDLRK